MNVKQITKQKNKIDFDGVRSNSFSSIKNSQKSKTGIFLY